MIPLQTRCGVFTTHPIGTETERLLAAAAAEPKRAKRTGPEYKHYERGTTLAPSPFSCSTMSTKGSFSSHEGFARAPDRFTRNRPSRSPTGTPTLPAYVQVLYSIVCMRCRYHPMTAVDNACECANIAFRHIATRDIVHCESKCGDTLACFLSYTRSCTSSMR